ncbi:MAG: hypothetical protein AAF633_13150 [Chloroflexota bacterium]
MSLVLLSGLASSGCINLPQSDAQSAADTIEEGVIKGGEGALESMADNRMESGMSNKEEESNSMIPSMASADREMMALVDPTVVEIEIEIPVITNFPDDEPLQTPEIRRALELLVIEKDIALVLDGLPEWHVDAWFSEEEGLVGINFYNHIEEWIGYGEVLIENGEPIEIFESYMPRELTPEEYQAGLLVVEPYVLQNPEVLGILGDPAAWERYTYYDKWESMWIVSFVQGLDALEVLVGQWEGAYYVEGVFDPNALEQEDQLRSDQDLAVSIAYEAEGMNDAVFAENETWTTVASMIDASQYGVSFIADGEELYFVLVDIETGEILETR